MRRTKFETIFIVLFLFFVAACSAFKKQSKMATNQVSDSSSTVVNQRPINITIQGDKAVATIPTDSLMKLISTLRPGRDTLYFPGNNSGVMLKLYRDQFNQLVSDCSSKDQLIQALVSDTTRFSVHRETITSPPVIVKETPGIYMVLIGGLAAVSIMLLISTIYLLKRYGKTIL